MSSEDETKKLLKVREDLKRRMEKLQTEIQDLSLAIAEIDRTIVRRGFRRPTSPVKEEQPSPASEEDEEDGQSSVKSKNGVTLGYVLKVEDEITFEPVAGLSFTTDIPPFQSFFIERVLDNMRSADETRVEEGDIQPEKILSYDVDTEGERIVKIVVHNYGGERRLREIMSSLRWTFDKMYEKLRPG